MFGIISRLFHILVSSFFKVNDKKRSLFLSQLIDTDTSAFISLEEFPILKV